MAASRAHAGPFNPISLLWRGGLPDGRASLCIISIVVIFVITIQRFIDMNLFSFFYFYKKQLKTIKEKLFF